MLSWSDLQTAYTDHTNDNSTANTTFGKTHMNRGYHKLIRAGNLDMIEYRTGISSVDGTYVYTLPPQYGKIKEVVWEESNQNYPLVEVETLNEWDRLRYSDSEGDPLKFMVRKSATGYVGQELWLWPTPNQDSVTIRVTYQRNVKDMANDDYTTGTITATADSTTVTGSGTTFTAAMVGRAIEMPDGLWYDITAFTSTTVVTIHYAYQGSTAASQSYTIGDIPLVPEPHQDAIYAYAVAEYYAKRRELDDAAYWRAMYETAKTALKSDRENRSSQQVIYGDKMDNIRSINDYPMGPFTVN